MHVGENNRDYGDVSRRVNQGLVNETEKTLGSIFDFQTKAFLEATKRMIECLSPVLDLYVTIVDLIQLKDPYKSTLFFMTVSLAILNIEAALSLALLSIVLAI